MATVMMMAGVVFFGILMGHSKLSTAQATV